MPVRDLMVTDSGTCVQQWEGVHKGMGVQEGLRGGEGRGKGRGGRGEETEEEGQSEQKISKEGKERDDRSASKYLLRRVGGQS